MSYVHMQFMVAPYATPARLMSSQQDTENFRRRLLDRETNFLELLIDMVEHRLTDIEDPAIQILRQLTNHGTRDERTFT